MTRPEITGEDVGREFVQISKPNVRVKISRVRALQPWPAELVEVTTDEDPGTPRGMAAADLIPAELYDLARGIWCGTIREDVARQLCSRLGERTVFEVDGFAYSVKVLKQISQQYYQIGEKQFRVGFQGDAQ